MYSNLYAAMPVILQSATVQHMCCMHITTGTTSPDTHIPVYLTERVQTFWV